MTPEANRRSDLFCYGCAHAAAGEPFPGKPSGERPCMFCVRNPHWEKWQTKFAQVSGTRVETWYDGSRAVRIPMDCYHSADMKDQIAFWIQLAKSLETAVADLAQGRWGEGQWCP